MEVSLSSFRREPFDEKINNEICKLDLYCLDEVREYALLTMTKYMHKITKYHDQRVKLRWFDLGDLVLHRVIEATEDLTRGKYNPTWEGPYKIVRYSRRGTYYYGHKRVVAT